MTSRRLTTPANLRLIDTVLTSNQAVSIQWKVSCQYTIIMKERYSHICHYLRVIIPWSGLIIANWREWTTITIYQRGNIQSVFSRLVEDWRFIEIARGMQGKFECKSRSRECKSARIFTARAIIRNKNFIVNSIDIIKNLTILWLTD